MTEPVAPVPAAPVPVIGGGAPIGPPPAPAKVSVWARLAKLAKNPALRPFEVWALRAAYAYIAVKIGIAADHAA